MIIKKILPMIAVLILCVEWGYPQGRTVSGTIEKSVTWEGTVLVTGDLSVPKGVTLIVKPGTTIKFLPNTDDQKSGKDANRSEIIVEGILLANAPRQTPIKFTSNSREPQAGARRGVPARPAWQNGR